MTVRSLTKTAKKPGFIICICVLDYPEVKIGGGVREVEIIEGSYMKLQCDVDSNPRVSSVQWTHDDEVLQMTNLIYSVRETTSQHAGVYTCKADNGLGKPAEASVEVKLLHPPRVELTSHVEVDQGSDVMITCKSAQSTDYAYWTKVNNQEFTQNGSNLHLTNVSSADLGVYVCHVVVEYTTVDDKILLLEGNASTFLFVKHPPGKTTIRTKPPIPIQGKTFTLQCLSDPVGWPRPTYRWWRKKSNKTIIMSQNLTLVILTSTAEDDYYCSSSNNQGESSVGVYHLTVHFAPQFTSALPSAIVKNESDVGLNLQCALKSRPVADIVWYHSYYNLDSGERVSVLLNSSFNNSVTIQNKVSNNHSDASKLNHDEVVLITSQLIFNVQLNKEHAGNYSCVAKNHVGEITSTTQLHINCK